MKASRKLRVLVVDSFPLTRYGLGSLTNSHPEFEVCAEVSDAAEARRLCEEDKPDVILMNMASSRTAGIGLLKEFRRLHPEVRLIVFGDHGVPDIVQRAFRAGAEVYVSTKDECADLLSGLESLLTGKKYVSHHTSEQMLDGIAPNHGRRHRDSVESLSDREIEIFKLIGRKCGPSEIARELRVSVKTVETHQERIKRKLALPNGMALHRAAEQWFAAG